VFSTSLSSGFIGKKVDGGWRTADSALHRNRACSSYGSNS
jgi:hypothetical protein